VITAYHLHEWIWGDWLKADYATWQRIGLRDLASFREWLTTAWPGFQTAEALTNGAKHFTQAPVTERIAGYGEGPYGIGPYGEPYLLIDHGSSAAAQRWQTAEQLLDEGVAFWKDFFADCSR
jgi:hypothetical protein